MYIPDNQSLKLIEIANAGIPNLEYITLFAAENINLAQYGLIIGYRPFEIATPLTNFIFGFLRLMLIRVLGYLFSRALEPQGLQKQPLMNQRILCIGVIKTYYLMMQM